MRIWPVKLAGFRIILLAGFGHHFAAIDAATIEIDNACDIHILAMEKYRCKKTKLEEMNIDISLTAHDCTEDGHYLVDKVRLSDYLTSAISIK